MTLADPAHSPAAEQLTLQLGHEFANADLLALALTHRSWCAEHPGFESNERLEFLGDAVLALAVTDHIFGAYPALPEGLLAKLRARVVSSEVLAEVGRRLGVGPALRLGKGEDTSGGRDKPSILADAVEALIGAVYLDAGAPAAAQVVLARLADEIAQAAAVPGEHDHKTQLQELVARRFEDVPAYTLTDEGPDHDKRFYATVTVAGRAVGTGEGRSKKLAEQAAASAALSVLDGDAAEANEGVGGA